MSNSERFERFKDCSFACEYSLGEERAEDDIFFKKNIRFTK